MKFTEFLMEHAGEFNGHKETTIRGLSLELALSLCKELQEEHPYHSFVVELWTAGSINIYQKDYWKRGEHPLGHTDRLILGSAD